MFHRCGSLKTLSIDNFNTSKGKQYGSNVLYFNNLLELDIDHFDTEECNKYSMMFLMCSKLSIIMLRTLTQER